MSQQFQLRLWCLPPNLPQKRNKNSNRIGTAQGNDCFDSPSRESQPIQKDPKCLEAWRILEIVYWDNGRLEETQFTWSSFRTAHQWSSETSWGQDHAGFLTNWKQKALRRGMYKDIFDVTVTWLSKSCRQKKNTNWIETCFKRESY